MATGGTVDRDVGERVSALETWRTKTDAAFERLTKRVEGAETAGKAAADASAKAVKAAAAAHAQADKGVKAAAAAHGQADKGVKAAAAAQAVADKAAKDAAAAATRADDAAKKADEAGKKAEELKKELTRLLTALGSVKPIKLPQDVSAYPYLSVPVPQMSFDNVVRRAIAGVADKFAVDPKILANALVAKGLASSVDRVTQALGRARMKDTKRHVLAAVYPHLLQSRLGNPPDPKKLKDPSGFARNLLIEFDSDGYVDAFADFIVAGSEKELSIKLADREKTALKQRVRESVI